MEKVNLEAEIRTQTGKQVVRKLRNQGYIPIILYKDPNKSLCLKVEMKKFSKILHTSRGENVIINLIIKEDGIKNDEKQQYTKSKEKTVIIKEIQQDPITQQILHVDLASISLTEKIEVMVPIEVKGEAIGVKRDHGILEHPLWEVGVECLPTQIPEKIAVDVSNMEIGNLLYVKDLKVSPEIKILNDPEQAVISVEPPRKEEVLEKEEEITEPEVISEKKKEEAEKEQLASEESKS